MVRSLVPEENRPRFFVYIIESPAAHDLYHKRYEGDLLQKALSLDSIPCSHRIAVSEEAFDAALLIGLKEQMDVYKELTPIMHISAHGANNGIQLTDGTIIDWDKLRQKLIPINKSLKEGLLLCMSSCEGFSACGMAMTKEVEQPFIAMIGNSGKPTWSDTSIAYAAFYHLIRKGYYVTDAVKAMCEASGDELFHAIRCNEAQKLFLDSLSKNESIQDRQRIQEEIDKNPPSLESKELENGKV